MSSAQFSNYFQPDYDPENVKSASKGKNSICVLAVGSNEPKQNEGVGGKVTRVVLENYMRRPSLKDDALMKLTEFAHNAICIEQTPNFHVSSSLAVLMTQGDHFRWLCAGDVHIFHFVNGQLMNSNKGLSPELGGSESKDCPPESLAETAFGQGENSFLLCSGSLLRYLKIGEIENALSLSDTAEDWLQSLKDLYEDRCEGESLSIMTVFVPSPKKRPPKAGLIAVIAVILVIALFFAFGAVRRRNERPDPSQMYSQQGPGHPPAQPTEPPEPTEPMSPNFGSGQPNVKPTKPPQPTPPPAPEAPQDDALVGT